MSIKHNKNSEFLGLTAQYCANYLIWIQVTDQKNHKNIGNWWSKVQYSSLKCENSYSCWGATEYSRDRPNTATHMMENKNNKIKLQLSYKYQNLSYRLFSRSILGCFAISRLWGAPWWTFVWRVRFRFFSEWCMCVEIHL